MVENNQNFTPLRELTSHSIDRQKLKSEAGISSEYGGLIQIVDPRVKKESSSLKYLAIKQSPELVSFRKFSG